VLRDGKVVLDTPVRRTTPAETVTAMVGHAVETARRASTAMPAPWLLEVEDLTVPGRLLHVGLALRAGEVLGVTGLAGSGLSELARAVFGALGKQAHGRVLVDGTPLALGDPSRALAAGIALLTGDRLREGLLPDFTLVDNICLPILSRFGGPAGMLDRPEMARTAERNIARLHVRTSGPLARARQLSGGNQQKMLFAKWLETRPKVFVMDEPTIGIDVGSKQEIRGIIDEIARAGVGIVLVTTELEELVLLCDRVLIMFRGTIVGELVGEAIAREAILHAAATGVVSAA
jgi:ABC-type sugar transport system ATPase subunit